MNFPCRESSRRDARRRGAPWKEFMALDNFRRRGGGASPTDVRKKRCFSVSKVLISPSGAANFSNTRAHWERGRWWGGGGCSEEQNRGRHRHCSPRKEDEVSRPPSKHGALNGAPLIFPSNKSLPSASSSVTSPLPSPPRRSKKGRFKIPSIVTGHRGPCNGLGVPVLPFSNWPNSPIERAARLQGVGVVGVGWWRGCSV